MSDPSQTSGTERFETYVQEYEKTSLALSQKIKSQIPNFSGGVWPLSWRNVETHDDQRFLEQKRSCIESAIRDVDIAEGIV